MRPFVSTVTVNRTPLYGWEAQTIHRDGFRSDESFQAEKKAPSGATSQVIAAIKWFGPTRAGASACAVQPPKTDPIRPNRIDPRKARFFQIFLACQVPLFTPGALPDSGVPARLPTPSRVTAVIAS
jgi:hypothetical protein